MKMDPEKTAFLLRLPTATHRSLKRLADDKHRSMNAQVVYLIERELEKEAAA